MFAGRIGIPAFLFTLLIASFLESLVFKMFAMHQEQNYVGLGIFIFMALIIIVLYGLVLVSRKWD